MRFTEDGTTDSRIEMESIIAMQIITDITSIEVHCTNVILFEFDCINIDEFALR